MLTNLKAMIVVVGFAYIIFWAARSICLRFVSEATFKRRRAVWFALTICAFCSPSFWPYAVFSMVLLGWAAVRDENPLALYALVTFTIPNAHFYVPTVLIGQLFDLTQYRILSLVVIIPALLRMRREPARWAPTKCAAGDFVLMLFILLQVVLTIPYEPTTTTLRRTFLLLIDTMLVFYAFSRVSNKAKLVDVLTCFWLACMIMAPIGIFERAKGWLLYTELVGAWGAPNEFAWLFRGGAIRAQAAADHSINFGYVLGVALSFFFYLRDKSSSRVFEWLAFIGLAVGIYASGSRGAQVAVAAAVVMFFTTRPNAARRLGGAVAVAALGLAVLYMSPLKESVFDRLPFIGTSDQDTVQYRQQLAEVSWTLIKQNPFFGDPFAYLNMESLRQGQGIIDIVNGYIYTALFNGLFGLALMLLVFGLALWSAVSAMFRVRHSDADLGLLGAALVSTFIATLVFIATAGVTPTTYLLAGLLVSYGAMVRRTRADTAEPTAATKSIAFPSIKQAR